MEAIILIVAVFLIFIVLITMYSFVQLWNENQTLLVKNNTLQQTLTTTESKNTELQTKLDNIMKQPSMIGLSYKTDNTNLQLIADNIKTILEEIQAASCPIIRDKFVVYRKDFIDSLTVSLQQKPVKCETIKDTFNTETSAFAEAIASGLPRARTDILKAQFKALIENILVIMCSDDKLDVAKVDKFLIDLFNAICYRT